MKPKPSYGTVPKPPRLKPATLPHPHRNLGAHLKAPTSGEIVTEHHRGARKAKP